MNAVDTFFKYLACSQPLTVTRTLELLVRLVSRSTSEIRKTWAEDMCQSHHFKRLMEMVMQQGDKRIKGLYEILSFGCLLLLLLHLFAFFRFVFLLLFSCSFLFPNQISS